MGCATIKGGAGGETTLFAVTPKVRTPYGEILRGNQGTVKMECNPFICYSSRSEGLSY